MGLFNNRIRDLENENISLIQENLCLKQIIHNLEKEKAFNKRVIEKRLLNMEEGLRILQENKNK